MDEPVGTVAETGVRRGFPAKSQKRPLSVLPGTSCPLFEGEMFRKVIVKVFPVISNVADASTGTDPGPVPDPVKVMKAAAASNDTAAKSPANAMENFEYFITPSCQ
jgi:hypothetical protein